MKHLTSLLILILALGLHATGDYHCGHDHLTAGFKPKNVKMPFNKRFLQSVRQKSIWRPLQIRFDFSHLVGLHPQGQNFLKNHLFPQVSKFFSNLLQTRYIPGLQIPITPYDCFNLSVPPAYIGRSIPEDILIMVGIEEGSYFKALASACTLNPVHQSRPFLGMIKFQTGTFSMDPRTYREWFRVIIHEVTHVLGMSNTLFPHFHDQSGNLRPNFVKDVVRRGVPTKIITLPRLVEWNQRHFNCPTDEGPELENQGSTASRGSHWEKRNYYNELMTPSVSDDLVLSELTLRLLESTGWWVVNRAYAQDLAWAKGEGCRFLQERCIDNNSQPIYHGFCDPRKEYQGCSFTRNSKGVCITTNGTVPPEFDYGLGKASDEFTDNCPVYAKPSESNCAFDMGQSQVLPIQSLPFDLLTPQSRCFRTRTPIQTPQGIVISQLSACMPAQCKVNTMGQQYVALQFGTFIVECPQEGGWLQTQLGLVECPTASRFCPAAATNECAAQNSCSALGACMNKRCFCAPGVGNQHDCHP